MASCNPGAAGRAPRWLARILGGLLAVGGLLGSAVTLAEEEAEWPKGHYPLPEAGNVIGEEYRVEAREEDTLLDIARAHNVGYEEIRRANPEVSVWLPGEGTEVVIPGRFILPETERTGMVINVAELRLYYYPEVGEGETPRVETYPIGIGREGFDTPLGVTETTMRLEDPAWYPPASVRREAAERGETAPAVVPPGPDNPLGRHAILLDIPGYLIHGTNQPDGIGMRASRGCIRMFPEDIESIFGRVPEGTRVELVDQPIKVGWEEGRPLVQVFAPLEEQEHGMTALMETLERLSRNGGADGDEAPVAVNYEQLRELLESPSGRVVALEPPREPEPEKAPAADSDNGFLDEVKV